MFLWEATKNVTERNMTPEHVVNMDDIGFSDKSRSKMIIDVHRYQNFWSKQADSSFHPTKVASCNAKCFSFHHYLWFCACNSTAMFWVRVKFQIAP